MACASSPLQCKLCNPLVTDISSAITGLEEPICDFHRDLREIEFIGLQLHNDLDFAPTRFMMILPPKLESFSYAAWNHSTLVSFASLAFVSNRYILLQISLGRDHIEMCNICPSKHSRLKFTAMVCCRCGYNPSEEQALLNSNRTFRIQKDKGLFSAGLKFGPYDYKKKNKRAARYVPEEADRSFCRKCGERSWDCVLCRHCGERSWNCSENRNGSG
jgi:hypothetical protein